MKKTLLLMMLGAFTTMPMTAQDEDMTRYIANAGFDEDLTFQVDGTMKDAISTTTSLSDRSWAYIAEDSTVYARPRPTSSQSRPDGRKMEAVNGFKGRVKGWTLESNSEFPQCEWTYFGTVPYDLQNQAVPIADDGTTYLEVPERPTEFDGGTGFVYLRAGWTNSAIYKQEVKLPCAVYRLEYWTININPNTSAVAADLTKIVCRRDEFKDEEGTGLNAQEWTKHEFEFTPVDKFTMQFGYQAANAGSGGQPIVALDGIKLYKIGEADPVDLLREDLYYYYDEVLASLPDSLVGVEGEYFYGLYAELEKLKKEYFYDGTDQAKLEESIAKLKELNETMLEAAKTALRVEALYNKALNILDATDYPGKDDLQKYVNSVNKLLYEDGTAADIIAAESALKEAINTYYFSQPADMENPADYSFLVQHPWFCVDGREPAGSDAASIADAAYTNDDRDATGWVNGSTASATTGQWLNVGRTCYQLWATNFTGYLDVHQDLTNLPNGIYSVSVDMITNAYALSDQHVYATSSLGQAEGYMTEEGVLWEWPNGAYTGGYPGDGSEPWETVSTEETVIVVDGKLTIGARSTHDGRCEEDDEDISDAGRRGSFWLTNFVLRYHGAATQEQIDAAVATRLKAAQDLADAMHFAADKKAVNDSIAAYNANKDLAQLNAAIALAQTSEAKYDEIMEEGKTLPTVAQNLEEDPEGIYDVALDLVRYANTATLAWLASDAATYHDVDAQLNQLKAYVNNYAQAAIHASEVALTFRSTAKNAVNEAIDTQMQRLMPGENKLLDEATVNEMVQALNKLLVIAQAQDTYDRNPNGTDYTGWIINPDFAEITGWDVIKGTGNGPLNSGQYYIENTETPHNYFDSYNGTAGKLDIYGEQVVTGLPNGTYTARAAARTSAPGAFLFAATGEAKADTIWTEIPMETHYIEAQDTTVYATDTYGSIWEAAFEKFNNGTADETENAIATCNGMNGRGWRWVTIEGIQVTDHQMTIGQTTDGTRTGKPFEGTWFSVVDWSLTLTAKGDNSDWNGPLTGVKDLNSNPTTAIDGIYTLDGRRTSQPTRGLYIVVRNGKASKILVK